MEAQKCCAHCTGKLSSKASKYHECCLPTYVSGNLRISSLKNDVQDCHAQLEQVSLREASPVDQTTCQEQFALAKRLHAENLEHQPLPDKVDDSIFRNARSSAEICRECCKKETGKRSMNLGKRYGPVLGCKEPKTKMDLAISWETPINSIYEASRPTRIDGSEGGLAPAIFSLVQRSSASEGATRSGIKKDVDNATSLSERKLQEESKDSKNKDRKRVKCCCDCLCRDLSGVNISKKTEVPPKRESFRKCAACQSRNSSKDPRLIKSAVGLALGTEKVECSRTKREGEIVRRPRTPFAGRSFCIDTLTPPFSVVNRYRDADYPEHWRLMSVYQQSYKNPYRRRIYRH